MQETQTVPQLCYLVTVRVRMYTGLTSYCTTQRNKESSYNDTVFLFLNILISTPFLSAKAERPRVAVRFNRIVIFFQI